MSSTLLKVREQVLIILREVLSRGKFASESMDRSLNVSEFKKKDRALLTQMVYGILREKRFLDHILSHYINFSTTPVLLQNLLRLGAYQICFLNKVPDHASVYESVEIAKEKGGSQAANFVNAVLRRIQKNKKSHLDGRQEVFTRLAKKIELTKKEVRELAWAVSFPDWVFDRWQKRYGTEQAVSLAQHFNSQAPVFLRVNQSLKTPEEILARLAIEGVPGERIPHTPILRLKNYRYDVLKPLWQAGLISVQDLGSFRISEAVGACPSEIGLDACSGHGGKLSAIAEMLGTQEEIYFHDPSEKKNRELRANFTRLGLLVPTYLSGSGEAKKRKLRFDWILVDAPCSGLGTVGRKPEIRWRLHAGDLIRYQKTQLGILEEWAPFLKPQGRILYSVCSMEPEEGRGIIGEFVKTHPQFLLAEAREIFPFKEGQDGFFLSRLVLKR